MKASYYLLWPIILLIGTAIAGITGWIKSILDILDGLRKAKEAKPSAIYVPQTTDEIVRYSRTSPSPTGRNTRGLYRMMMIAIACGIVAAASAAVVVPTVIRAVQENRELKRRLEEIVPTKTPEPREQATSPEPTIVPTPAPPVTPNRPPTPTSTTISPRDYRSDSSELRPRAPSEVETLNRRLLRYIDANDYYSLRAYSRELTRNVTREDFASMRSALGTGFNYYEKNYLGSITEEESATFFWKLPGERSEVLEILTVDRWRQPIRLRLEYDFASPSPTP
ncbi:MAG: hypothetical protein ACREFF_02855 [Candidatus Udaeobacter sp.]